MVKAHRYANYIQKDKAAANGVDVQTLTGYIKKHLAELDNSNFETISNEETLEEDKSAYDQIRVG